MNPELLQAYHYLSSAIVQAFAALIALTAMFYVYRRQIIINRKKSCTDQIKLIIFEQNKKNYFPEATPQKESVELQKVQFKTAKKL